jgi:hypothetical protein
VDDAPDPSVTVLNARLLAWLALDPSAIVAPGKPNVLAILAGRPDPASPPVSVTERMI